MVQRLNTSASSFRDIDPFLGYDTMWKWIVADWVSNVLNCSHLDHEVGGSLLQRNIGNTVKLRTVPNQWNG
jgi:hypothetical protein